jgi:hypothetical protein
LTLATGNSQVLFGETGFAQTYGEVSYHEYQHNEIASTIKATGGVTGMGGEVLVVEQSNSN